MICAIVVLGHIAQAALERGEARDPEVPNSLVTLSSAEHR